MSLEGKEFVKYGQYGSKLGEFGQPFACMCDDNDNLLIADMLNNRLQLMHGEQWSEMELQPPPNLPTDAVFDGQAIYVLDAYRKLLLKYDTTTASQRTVVYD